MSILLMAVGMVSIASAQSGRFDNGKQGAGYSFHANLSWLQQKSTGRGKSVQINSDAI